MADNLHFYPENLFDGIPVYNFGCGSAGDYLSL